MNNDIERLRSENARLTGIIVSQAEEGIRDRRLIENLHRENQRLSAELQKAQTSLAAQSNTLAEKDARIAELSPAK